MKIDKTSFIGRVYETENSCFEVTMIQKPNGELYDDCVDIKFTNKESKPFIEDYIDSTDWMLGVYTNNPCSMTEANEMFSKQMLKEFKFVIYDLVDDGWLKFYEINI